MPGTKSKHLVLRTYTFQKLFFHINLFFTKKYGIVSLHQITHPLQKANFALQKQDFSPISPNLSAFFFIITLSFCKKYSSHTTRFKLPLPICRAFACLSPHPHQKVEEKLANVQKRPYLCGVKMKINEQLTIDFRDKNKKQ